MRGYKRPHVHSVNIYMCVFYPCLCLSHGFKSELKTNAKLHFGAIVVFSVAIFMFLNGVD